MVCQKCCKKTRTWQIQPPDAHICATHEAWHRETAGPLRLLSRAELSFTRRSVFPSSRFPSVAGLVVLRGRGPPAALDSSRSARRASDSNHATNPRVRGVALCLGGSRVLVYRPDEIGRCVEDDNNNMRQLRAFLDDKRVTVACVGGWEAAARLVAEEWGLHMARPAELTDLFLRAYGKVADNAEEENDAPWIMPDEAHKHRIRRSSLFAGTTTMKRARQTEWQQATRDAYLCFGVAVRCLQKFGTPIGT